MPYHVIPLDVLSHLLFPVSISFYVRCPQEALEVVSSILLILGDMAFIILEKYPFHWLMACYVVGYVMLLWWPSFFLMIHKNLLPLIF